MKRAATFAALALALLAPAGAKAFCGFYVGGAETSLTNDATMVVMMRDGTRTVLSMQNSYQGPPERFAMVVPVPVVLQEDNVRTLADEVFARVDRLAAPRLVEYWEQDPCARPRPVRRMRGAMRPQASASGRSRSRRSADHGVTVEAQFQVGEYDVVILSAEDSGGLDTWLRQEGYHIPPNAEPALRPYVQAGTKFFVARVDPTRVTFQNGRAVLSPLRVHYDAETFSLPVRLGMINSPGTQDLVVHVLARNQRYELANYDNVFIPTNFEVRAPARGQFGAFYAALFDKTMEVNPGAVVTEYAWQAGSCDPCPGPTLTASDIATLGGDVVGGDVVAGGSPSPRRGRGRVFMGGGAGPWTLTRLHYRYGRGGLDEDLVFRGAPPVAGGRGTPNQRGRFEREVTSSGINNFQGRYAILHRWRGAIECANPQRGRWGGPPNGTQPRPQAAQDLATQPRRGVSLQRYLHRPLPELRRSGGGGGRGSEPMSTELTGPTAQLETSSTPNRSEAEPSLERAAWKADDGAPLASAAARAGAAAAGASEATAGIGPTRGPRAAVGPRLASGRSTDGRGARQRDADRRETPLPVLAQTAWSSVDDPGAATLAPPISAASTVAGCGVAGPPITGAVSWLPGPALACLAGLALWLRRRGRRGSLGR